MAEFLEKTAAESAVLVSSAKRSSVFHVPAPPRPRMLNSASYLVLGRSFQPLAGASPSSGGVLRPQAALLVAGVAGVCACGGIGLWFFFKRR